MAVGTARADAVEPAVTMTTADAQVPAVTVPGDDTPLSKLTPAQLKVLGGNMRSLFDTYRSDRRLQEMRWMRNLRQYLGFYDPEVEGLLSKNRSRAYPKLTRTKCISMLSRIMNLVHPSDDRNWTLEARPSADMDITDVRKAIQDQQQEDAKANNGQAPQIDDDYVKAAVRKLATKRASELMTEIDDQLQELGGDQSYDYPQLDNEVIAASILYGIGLLRGPFVREVDQATWTWDATKQDPVVAKTTRYMPQFQFMSVWDFFPDMGAKRLEDMDGYFTRIVVGRSELRKFAKQSDFFEKTINEYLKNNRQGNYKPLEFETELRTMGVKANVSEMKRDGNKFEIIIWHGPIDAHMLENAGAQISSSKMGQAIEDAEVWLLDSVPIKAVMNPWAQLKRDVRMLHYFMFDKDDTSPIGFGLPNVMRDTQMSLAATVRMMLDNASVTCGPMLEMNTNMLRGDQDLTGIHAYKVFYRDDDASTASIPAIREIKVDAHLGELEGLAKMFLGFADTETFIGPMTGGDQSKMPGEPMRNLVGASMLMGDAALPFKQIIRNFDNLTRSVIQSLVEFNREFNDAPEADYDVIARGATSLIAKEVRGMQIDSLVSTMKPQEEINADWRKITQARFASRDMEGMLVTEDVAAQRQAAQDQAQQLQTQLQQANMEANTRNLLAQALKNIAQGNKNTGAANVEAINAALAILEKGAELNGIKTIDNGDAQSGNANPQAVTGSTPGPNNDPSAGIAGLIAGAGAQSSGPGAGPGGMPNLTGQM